MSPNFDRVVIRYCYVVLAAFGGCQPQMTARLPCDLIAELPERLGQLLSRDVSRNSHSIAGT